jgi:ectoine hydroxylase-related dioxygenase (phytanoyl-CoA dioxygenase family)
VNHSADDIRREYARTGFVVFRNVLDPGLIADTNRHVDWLLDRHPDLRADELGHELARDDPFWYRLVSDPRLVDIAEIFIGSDVALFASHYICKEPGIGRAVPWHQDGGYWPLEPMEVVSLWLAVTESTRANGCLKLVPGSHTTRLMEMVPTNRDEVLPLEVPVAVDEQEAVALELAPGDVSVHHPNIVHGSDANTSTSWRRGLTIRYIPTTTRILDAAMSAAFLLRGDPVPGVNKYLAVPTYDPERHMAFENRAKR